MRRVSGESQLIEKHAWATTHSAISVVNAIPAGKGVAIGIDMPCRVMAFLRQHDNKRQNPKRGFNSIKVQSQLPDRYNLIRTTSEYSLQSLGVVLNPRDQLFINVNSQIPVAVGLKSSSAVSTAVVKTIFELFSGGTGSETERQVLKVSCRASKDCGASITGAFDDAAASLLGGIVFSDNTKSRLIKHSPLPASYGSIVVLLLPLHKKRFTGSLDRSVYSRHKSESLKAFRYALNGEIAQAMLINSIVQCVALGYSIRAVTSALCEGANASGITGKGPAVAALCSRSKAEMRIRSRWTEENPESKIITTKIVQPGNTRVT